ncbi:MAG: PilZ domain-containing protein [Anaerolineales bacterium]|nr:PilZ domain-containing protein [Anaerolineales bacterium]MCZ2122306.1 PilZ domain-containing protein [Anaerolineales bacterium]
MPEKRTVPRKKFEMYMRVLDDDTQETLGHMVDISEDGLQLETSAALPVNKDYYMRVELTPELADRPFMIFLARSRWCKPGNIPFLFYTGFKIVEIMPDDKQTFQIIAKKFGK